MPIINLSPTISNHFNEDEHPLWHIFIQPDGSQQCLVDIEPGLEKSMLATKEWFQDKFWLDQITFTVLEEEPDPSLQVRSLSEIHGEAEEKICVFGEWHKYDVATDGIRVIGNSRGPHHTTKICDATIIQFGNKIEVISGLDNPTDTKHSKIFIASCDIDNRDGVAEKILKYCDESNWVLEKHREKLLEFVTILVQVATEGWADGLDIDLWEARPITN